MYIYTYIYIFIMYILHIYIYILIYAAVSPGCKAMGPARRRTRGEHAYIQQRSYM